MVKMVTVAAYIDLNPVRAGVVEDPKEYRWSGYGEAVGRGGRSLNGIGKLFCGMDLNEGKVLEQYRKTLYCEGVCRLNAFTGAVSKPGFTRSVVDKVFDEEGELAVAQVLRCRVRYLTDGVIIGGRDYVDKTLKYFSVVAICVMLSQSGCVKKSESINRLEWSCMSTTAAVQSADMEIAAQLRMIATQQFEEAEQEFSAWRPTSTLTMINQRAGTNKKTPVSCAFTNLLQLSVAMHHNSGGAFNPLLAPVLHLWGFGNLKTTLQSPPRTNELSAALRLTEPSDIKIESEGTVCTARLLRNGMQLDFGAIAKGYAVDLAWRQAVKQGISNVLIDLGGNLRVLGEARPGRGGWLTGIKDPFNAKRLIARVMLYDGEAVATSGNYERFIEIDGKRYAHIIDGRSAWPANGTASVTVIASDAVTADALSTTLFILGADDGQRMIAEHHPDVLALWIPVKQPVEIIATDNMRKRLQP